MPTLSQDLKFRGLVHQVSDPELLPMLDRGELSAYAGFDPSAPSLHVGNLLGILTLRRLQEAGNRSILLAGGGTGLVGDPGGRSDERSQLSKDEVASNVEAVRSQLGRFLELSGGPGRPAALLLDNSAWLASVGYLDFLRDVGKRFTVNQMVAKESVKSRLDRPDQGISYTEFSYMLLQAYDFLHLYDELGCRLQLGGSDQWGNITMGIELIRKSRGAEAYALTWPLLLRADGSKYGKSVEGAVWLDPQMSSPYALYQSFIRVPDDIVGAQLRQLTFLSHDEIGELDEETSERPEHRAAQRALARAVCVLVHGEAETARAERAARSLFSEEIAALDATLLAEVLADAPSTAIAHSELDGSGADLLEVLVRTGLVASKSAARTVLDQGGVYVSNRRRLPDQARLTGDDVLAGAYVVLRRGQKDYHVLCLA